MTKIKNPPLRIKGENAVKKRFLGNLLKNFYYYYILNIRSQEFDNPALLKKQ
jgi:hypothetical protein